MPVMHWKLMLPIVVVIAASVSPVYAQGWKLVLSESGAPILFTFDPHSGAVQIISSEGQLSNPTGVSVRADGQVYVLDRQAFSGTGALFLVDPETGIQTVLKSGGQLDFAAFGIDIAGDGTILVPKLPGPVPIPGQLLAIDPTGASVSIVATGGLIAGGPLGVLSHPNGDYYVTTFIAAPGAGGSIVRIDPQSGGQTLLVTIGDQLQGIANDDLGRILVTTEGPPARLIRVDPESGATQDLAVGGALFFPRGVVAAPDGRLFLADSDTGICPPTFDPFGAIIAVDAVSGGQSPNCLVPEHLLFDPYGIDVLPSPPVQTSSSTWGRLKSIYR